jgi:hypothetical protein
MNDLSDTGNDMLINAELRVGGRLGVGTESALNELRQKGLVGTGGGLTRRGVTIAKRLFNEYWRAAAR